MADNLICVPRHQVFDKWDANYKKKNYPKANVAKYHRFGEFLVSCCSVRSGEAVKEPHTHTVPPPCCVGGSGPKTFSVLWQNCSRCEGFLSQHFAFFVLCPRYLVRKGLNLQSVHKQQGLRFHWKQKVREKGFSVVEDSAEGGQQLSRRLNTHFNN